MWKIALVLALLALAACDATFSPDMAQNPHQSRAHGGRADAEPAYH